MNKSEIESKVKSVVAEQLGVPLEEVGLDKSFKEDLGADSLDSVELVMSLEDTFGIEISESDAEGITTVKIAVDYISKNLA